MEHKSSGKTRGRTFFKGQCLDFIAAAYRDSIYPFISCRFKYSGRFDLARLTRAVQLSGEIVPELYYAYDYRRGGFIDRGFSANDVVLAGTGKFEEGWKWDFSTGTQLKILVLEDTVVFGMSHLLCDGAGFLQYLYMLAALYNGAQQGKQHPNQRDIVPLLTALKTKTAAARKQCFNRIPLVSLPPGNSTKSYFCLTAKIGPADLEVIHKKAKHLQVSLNDVFLAAYARVLAGLFHVEELLLPCPVDLRRLARVESLTIANMTGMLTLALHIKRHDSFHDTLLQVQNEINLQKTELQCAKSIGLLSRFYAKLPARAVYEIIKSCYDILPLSYTNVGVINAEKLAFHGIALTDCFLTGTYRCPPDFQLTVSTFQNTCTMNCTLLGSDERKVHARQILDAVLSEIQAWALGEDSAG